MGFEIDKSAEDLKQNGTNIISDNQVVGEEHAAPLTNAENQDLTYNLTGEAQSAGFSEQEADELTNGLSGENLPLGDSTIFKKNKTKENSYLKDIKNKVQDKPQNLLSYNIQFILNTYPNIVKTRIQDNVITFLDKNNSAVLDKNGKPLTIENNLFKDKFQINLFKTCQKHNNNELDVDKTVYLAKLQEKFNVGENKEDDDNDAKEVREKILKHILTELDVQTLQSLNNEEQTKFIEEKLYNAFVNNEIPEDNIIDSPNEKSKHSTILNTPNNKNDVDTKELRKQISNTNSIDDLKTVQKHIDKLTLSKSERTMLNNEFVKQKGILLAKNNNPTSISDNNEVLPDIQEKISVEKDNFDEQRIRSHTAFEYFKKCQTPVQREMANIILKDKRLYLSKENSAQAFNTMIETCKTKDDVSIKKQLIDKVLENDNLLENNVLNPKVTESISNATAETFDLQLKILEIYQKTDSDTQSTSPNTEKTKDCLKCLAEHSFNTENSELLEFSKKIIFDDNLNNDATALETLLIILESNTTDTDTLAITYNILQTDTSNYNAEEICNAANTIVNDDSTKNFIENYIKNDNQDNVYESKSEEILGTLIEKDKKILKKFVSSRDCTKENLYDVFKHVQHNYGKEILSDISNQQQYSTENIINVLKYTTDKTSDATKQVLEKKNITANEKVGVLYAIKNNQSQIELIKVILNNDNINLKVLPKLLTSIGTLNQYNIKYKKDDISPDKIDNYIQLLQNPKTSPWVIEMLNQGWDIETISQLNQTKIQFYANKNNKVSNENNINKKFFISAGFDSKDADKIIEALTKNNCINDKMKQVAIELLNADIPRHRIGDVLNDAMTTGAYNPKIVIDTEAISSLGLNSFLERYLPIANNLSYNDLTAYLSTDIRKNLITMINQIPEEKKQALKVKGFNLNVILNNLYKINSTENLLQNDIKIENDDTMDISVNGKKMRWYTIPKTSSSDSEFSLNIKRIEELSYGTTWDLSKNTENLQNGNIHFLVDENGLPQAFIRENKDGRIAEIQKRFQDESVPVAFIEYIQGFMNQKGLTGYDDKIQSALKNKPIYDSSKTEIENLIKNQNYKAILEKMNIKVNELPDGSWEISHYSPYINGLTLHEFNIDENKLLSNVSVIKGDADFKNSNATKLPNLKKIDGEIRFGNNEFTDLSGLEEINKKKILWEYS